MRCAHDCDSEDELAPTPACTFATASGRGVRISGVAMDRAARLFDYELPEGFVANLGSLSIGGATDANNDDDLLVIPPPLPAEEREHRAYEPPFRHSPDFAAGRHMVVSPPLPAEAMRELLDAHEPCPEAAETLVSTLKTSVSAKDDVAKSLTRVRKILEEATEAPTALLECGVAAGIVSVMRRFAHDNDMLVEACWTIDDLAVFDEAHEFLADAGVAQAICGIVSGLAVTVTNLELPPESEKHDELLSVALSVAGVIAQSVDEGAPFELAARACATILERLGCVASRAQVVVRTLRTLDRLVAHQPAAHLRAFSGGGGVDALKSMINNDHGGEIRVALHEFVETAAVTAGAAATDDETGQHMQSYVPLLALLDD